MLRARPAKLAATVLTLVALVALVATFAAIASPLLAQGRGNGNGKSRGHGPTTPPSSGSAAATAVTSSVSASHEFGAWLDDASLVEPGLAWTSLSFGHFRSESSKQTDLPVFDASLGTRRAQWSVSLPYYSANFADGTGINGFGDLYLSAKFQLKDPATSKRGFGLAVTPLMEVGTGIDGGRRVALAAPVSLELRRSRYRVFGSSGFFTRGAFFAGSVVEVPVNEQFVVSTALSYGRSLKADPISEEAGLSRNRGDLTAVASYALTHSASTFMGVGRTLGSGSPASIILTGGVSFTFNTRNR